MLSPDLEQKIHDADCIIRARDALDDLIAAVGKRGEPRLDVMIGDDDTTLEEANSVPKDIIIFGLQRMAEEAARQATVLVATIQATRASPSLPETPEAT